MLKRLRFFIYSLLFLQAGFTSFCYAEQTFFRFLNTEGRVEIKSSITPEEARLGYSVVTASGRVVRTVEAEKSQEEKALLKEKQQSAQEERVRLDQQKANDELLLLRFSSLSEIEAERVRKLAEFDQRIEILQGSMSALKTQVENQQRNAANIERTGREVPESIRNNISDLKDKILDAETSLLSRLDEKQALDVKYQRDLKRFQQITQLRRQL